MPASPVLSWWQPGPGAALPTRGARSVRPAHSTDGGPRAPRPRRQPGPGGGAAGAVRRGCQRRGQRRVRLPRQAPARLRAHGHDRRPGRLLRRRARRQPVCTGGALHQLMRSCASSCAAAPAHAQLQGPGRTTAWPCPMRAAQRVACLSDARAHAALRAWRRVAACAQAGRCEHAHVRGAREHALLCSGAELAPRLNSAGTS